MSGAGPTGNFPEGKLGDDDEGEIRVAIGNHEGKVVIDFGKPVAWIGLPPQRAIDLAERIILRARLVATEPLVLRLSGKTERKEVAAAGAGELELRADPVCAGCGEPVPERTTDPRLARMTDRTGRADETWHAGCFIDRMGPQGVQDRSSAPRGARPGLGPPELGGRPGADQGAEE